MLTVDPLEASNFVQGVDRAFIFILGVSLFFLVGLTALMIYFIFRYRRDKHPKAVQNEGNMWLEITWTVIPLGLVIIMFIYGWTGWKPMQTPPDDAMRVTATARMWNFKFTYDNGRTADSLYLPVGQPVILDLVALDVLHSLYIPAFRVKEDMVPGRDKVMWFIPQQVGDYELFCTEYCGLQHSYMHTRVKVLPEEEYNAWISDTTAMSAPVPEDATPADLGYQVMVDNGCIACHSSDGSTLVGPSYLGIWGSTTTVITGREERQVVVDEEYVRRSIYEPNADVVKGFNRGLMLPYEGQVSEEEIGLIVEYLKSLNE